MSSLEEMLRKVKKQRWENHQQIIDDRNTCYYSEGEGCTLCRNKNKCILDEVLWADEQELAYLQHRKEELEEIIRISKYEKEIICRDENCTDDLIRKWLQQNFKVSDSWLSIIPQVKKELESVFVST